MNDSIIDLISSTNVFPTTTEILNKGYWDTMEGQALKTAKRWARDVLISLTSIVLLVTIIVSVSCIRAYIKSRNDALVHDPEDRWIKSMCFDSKIPLMDSRLYEEQTKLLIVKIDDKDDIESLLKNMEKLESNHKNGLILENTNEDER